MNVSVVRLPQVHDTVKQGLITYAVQVAREKGASAYIGEGLNRWPAAHVLDVAHLYRLALEKHEAGSRYNAVAEEGVSMREIAEVIGRGLKVPVVSLSQEEAQAHFGWLAMFAGFDMPASSAQTRQRLGWHPTGPGLIADLEQMRWAEAELAAAVAIQRACSPGPKRDLAEFLDGAVPRLSCLPSSAFTGQAYHRVAQHVADEQLERAQIAIAKAAVARFQLSADVLAFDTTNFDTHIATVTPGELARRGHAKSKRSDLRVVGLGVLASETGYVPLLYRTYAGNSSDQAVLTSCLEGLRALHQSLDAGEGRERAQRTLVRDGGFWSPQLELDLETIGYYNLISLPLGHAAAEQALQMAAKRGAMKPLTGKLAQVRAARVQAKVGNLDRTLVVVESQDLLEGQKRGIAVALRKAKDEFSKLERLVKAKRISRNSLEQRIKKTLGREHLSRFVVTEIGGDDKQPTLRWHVDAARRRQMEKTRLGRATH